MASLSKSEIENSTYLYDNIYSTIMSAALKPLTFSTIQRLYLNFFNKNSHVLQTNIIGRQLLINKEFENSILAVLDVKQSEILKTIKESPYMKQFKDMQLINQFAFALPIIMLSQAYMEIGKIEQSNFIFLTTFFKPYASRVSRYFKFFNDKNEQQMLFIIENKLSQRYDVKKYGTLIEILQKKSEISYDNYKESLSGHTKDAEYQTIFQAGIYSRVNDLLKNIAEVYYDQKNEKEFATFTQTSMNTVDDDGVEDNIAIDARSDAAIKFQITQKAIKRLTATPIDPGLIQIAIDKGFGKTGELYQQYLKDSITGILDKGFTLLPEFIESIVSSFLFNENPATGKKYLPSDIKTIRFIAGAFNIFTHTRTIDINILKTKEILNQLLEYAEPYQSMRGNTMKIAMRNSIYMYFVLLIRKVA